MAPTHRFPLVALILSLVLLTLATSQISAFGENKPVSKFDRFWNYVFGRSQTSDFSTEEDPELSVLTSPDRKKAKEQTIKYALSYKQPDAWDATFFFPADSVSQALDTTLRNTVIEFPDLRGLSFTIKQVRFRSGYGSGDVELILRPSLGGKKINFEIAAIGTLLYQGFRPPSEKGTFVSLAVEIKSVRSNRRDNLVAILGHGVGTALTLAFRDQLRVEIPMPPMLQMETGYSATRSLRTADNRTINLLLSLKGARVGPQFEDVAAIFVPAGLWIAASNNQVAPAASAQSGAGLEELLKSYQAFAVSSPTVHVKGRAIEDAINRTVKSLKDVDLRTLHAYAVSGDKELINKRWRDNVLGDGGTKVSLDRFYDFAAPGKSGPDASVTIDLKEPVKWTAAGLKLSMQYAATLKAPLHVHIDPLVSGGVGSTIGSHATSKGTISGVLQVVAIAVDNNARALALRPVLDQTEVQLELKSDGKFKVSDLKLEALGGWTKIPGFEISVPEFGVRVTLPLSAESIPPFVLFDSAPLPMTLSNPISKTGGPTIRLPERLCYLTISPKEVVTDADGIRARCDLSVAEMRTQEFDARTTAVKAALKEKQNNTLPKLGSVEVLLGGIEFGQSNDFYKLVVKVVEAMNKVAGEAKKTGKKVEKELGNAGKELESALHQVKANPLKAIESFGQQRKKDAQKVIDVLNPNNWSL